MTNLNKVLIAGRLGGDPDVRRTTSAIITNMSIASSEKYKDKETGETKEITEWHKVVLFNRLAEVAEKYLKKGSAVFIEGKLKTEKYTDKDGIERYVTKIIGNNLQMLDSKTKTEGEAKAKSDPRLTSAQDEAFDDDIPF
jgi:single-strand DNA-binding protein